MKTRWKPFQKDIKKTCCIYISSSWYSLSWSFVSGVTDKEYILMRDLYRLFLSRTPYRGCWSEVPNRYVLQKISLLNSFDRLRIGNRKASINYGNHLRGVYDNSNNISQFIVIVIRMKIQSCALTSWNVKIIIFSF